MELDFLKSLVLIFGLSAITVFILNKLRAPSIIGFLIAGVFLGPHGLELIDDVHLVEIFAEIGVVLLLFTIGIEFSLKKIFSLRKAIFAGGFLQVLLTTMAVFLLLRYIFNKAPNTSLVLGLLTALSSTAIVMKLLFERNEIDSPHGRISMGILIFQDLFVVLFMLMIPILSGVSKSPADIFLILVKSFGIIAAVIFSARWLVPRALHQIVHSRIRELFVISIIFICLGTAYLTHKLGLSLALGAFIAGLIISESEYSYQALSDILPFKDSFNGLFFISVGMLMDLDFFLSNFETVLIIVSTVIILKTLTSTVAVLITGSNPRVSLHSGLVLSQIGEFSFVISVAALEAGLLSENNYQFFLSSAIITMMLTPLFVSFSPQISTWAASRRLLARLQSMRSHTGVFEEEEEKSDHVIIVGFGPSGKNLSIVLKELEVPYAILELNSNTVAEMRKEGEPIFYGDGTSREILHKLCIEKARSVVIVIPDPCAARRIVKTTREMNRNLYIIVSTRYLAEVEDLLSAGADEVIPAEFELSIELFCRVLHYYNMPKTMIGRYADKFRKDHYKLFIKGESPKRQFHDIVALMPDSDHESYTVHMGSRAVDSTIKRLDIQNRTGAHVISVRRGNQTMTVSGDFIFQKGDIVMLIGEMPSLKKANSLFFKKKGKPLADKN